MREKDVNLDKGEQNNWGEILESSHKEAITNLRQAIEAVSRMVDACLLMDVESPCVKNLDVLDQTKRDVDFYEEAKMHIRLALSALGYNKMVKDRQREI